MSVYDLEITDGLLTTTRAVRKRLDLDRDVPDSVITECLTLALQAPSGANRQGWQWLVIRDADKRAKLADMYRQGAGTYLSDAEKQALAENNAKDARVFSSARYLADNFEKVPVLVMPCIDVGHLPEQPPRTVWAGVMGSIFPAVWSFQLALRARGLGSALTTLHLKYEADAAVLLGIPPHIMQVGLLPVAYTKGTDFKPAARHPLEEVVHWDAWGG